MKLTPSIQKAINLASCLHAGQVRKGNDDLPYISHPYSVAWILSNYTKDEDVVVAGILHDVLEDVEAYHYDDLLRDFGEKVAQIVDGVSEDRESDLKTTDKLSSWEGRKLSYLNKIKKGSEESLILCAADKIHNLQSMIDAYLERGEDLWKSFNSPKDKKLWLYKEVLKVVKLKLNNPIVDELEKLYNRAEKILL